MSIRNNPLLETKSVRTIFGGVVALKDVSFGVSDGEILGLIGPNGAGKTTLFHVIAGKEQPTNGKINFRSQDITGLRPDQRCHLGIARTFQIPQPFSQMTVFENVMVALHFGAGEHTRSLEDEASHILGRVGLDRWASQESSSLPLGARKKLELARALATKPTLLLLDEVMGGLRPNEITEIMETIREVRASGVTIIMIEHVMRAVMGLADRIIVLHHGELIAEGSPAEITQNEAVIEAYLGGSAHVSA
jgi:branched-chain amino acid transport system ATP-binding protein